MMVPQQQQQLKLQFIMRLRGISSLLFRRNIYQFSEEEGGNKLFRLVKSAWSQTFPEDEQKVKLKYQKVKQQKRYSQEQLEKIQQDTPQYLKKALVSSDAKPTEEKEGFKLSNVIPEPLKARIKGSSHYKEYEVFKENLKEYASTREGPVANLGTAVYSKFAKGSPQARATEIMKQYIPDFNLYQLEDESTVIFKNTYHAYLRDKLSQLQLMTSEQGYEYFSAHVKMFKNKKWKPRFEQMVFNYPSQLNRARIGQNLIPKFDFTIKIMHIYCFVDAQGNVVEGSEDRVESSVFEFSLTYCGEHIADLGHPWTLCEVKEVEKMQMLV